MDTTAIYLIIMLATLLAFSPYLIELIRMKMDNRPSLFDIIRARQQKEPLRQMLLQTRLSGMLAYLGFTQDDYMMTVPEGEIRTHIGRCKTCRYTSACDRCLKKPDTDCDMKFCPNYPSLLACSRPVSG